MSDNANDDRRPDPHEKRNEDRDRKPYHEEKVSSDGSDIDIVDELIITAGQQAIATMSRPSINVFLCAMTSQAFSNMLQDFQRREGRPGNLPFVVFHNGCGCGDESCLNQMTLLAFAGADGKEYAYDLAEKIKNHLKERDGKF